MIKDGKQGQGTPTLLSLATVVRFRAQRLTGWKLRAQFISAVLSAGSIFYNQFVAWSLLGASLAAGILAFVWGSMARNFHELSREAQRLALLEDSLGKLMDPFQTVELRRKIGSRLEEVARRTSYEQPYYTGAHQPGTTRLLENVQQSTFWSRNLLEFYGKQMRRRIVATIILVGGAIYLTLAIDAESGRPFLNPYSLSLGGLTLVMGILGYVETALACKSAVTSLLELDRRLDTVDFASPEAILANFADYCIAGVSAPPIPFSLYRKHHPYLRRLWSLRSDTPVQLPEVAEKVIDIPEIEYDPAILPTWTTHERFSSLILEAVREMVIIANRKRVSRIAVLWIPGLSGTPVYDVRISIEATLWRQVVLRLHPDAEGARRELAIVKMIARESADLVSYVPVEEPFVSRGALFYYHANIQTNDQLLPLNEFVMSYFSSRDATFDGYFLRMLNGLRSVGKCFDALSVDYSMMDSRSVLSGFQVLFPPQYVIDLRRHKYELRGNSITVFRNGNGRVPPSARGKSRFNPMGRDWCQSDSPIVNDGNPVGDVLSLDIEVDGHRCRILVPIAQSRLWPSEKRRRVTINFIPREHAVPLSQYLDLIGGVQLNGFDPERTLQEYISSSSKEGLLTGFRHRDLHCSNCLVSISNFKLIDVGDSGPGALVCADLARLELSLLSRLAESAKLTTSDIDEILTLLDRGNGNGPIRDLTHTVARVIAEIRRVFLETYRIHPSRVDWVLSFYLECCQQVSYSLSSPLRLSSAMSAAVRFWDRKVVELTA